MSFPNVPFKEADDWTPELANLAFNTPVFDGDNTLLGHRQKIQDTELSDSGVKLRLASVTDNLKVSVESGLILRHNTGKILINHEAMSIASGLVAVTNGIQYVYVDRFGVIGVGDTLPAVSLPLAKVTVVSDTISLLEDIRALTDSVLPRLDIIRTFGGTNVEDKVFTQGEVLDQGEYFFRDVLVPVGVSITVKGMAVINCSGNMTVNGTVNVGVITRGAMVAAQFVQPTRATFQVAGIGLGGNGDSYPYGVQPYGSGGASAVYYNADNVNARSVSALPAGGGGGAFIANVAGSITVSTSGAIVANGSDGTQGTDTSFIPTGGGFIQYPYGTLTFPGLFTGSGGGSGGFVRLAAVQGVEVKGYVSANGGNGSDGLAVNTSPSSSMFASGGSGGTGGIILIMSTDTNTTGGTLEVKAGIPGIADTTGNWVKTNDSYSTSDSLGYIHAGGSGGGFGGSTGGWAFEVNGGVSTVAHVYSTDGQILFRSFLPVS